LGYRLKYIKPYNLFRFGPIPQEIYIPNEEVLLTGLNEDNEGTDSNGTGKTSFLNTVSWVLLGEVVQDIDAQGVIREGCSSGGGEIALTDDHDTFIIIRERGIKETLEFNGKETNLTKRTTSQTQEEILRTFNLDLKKYFSDYCNTVYFSSSTVKGFASNKVTNAERMNLLTRFLNLISFDLAIIRIKELIKAEEASQSLVLSKVQEITRNIPLPFINLETYELDIDEQILQAVENKEQWIKYKQSLLEQKQQIATIQALKSQLETLKLKQKTIEDNQKRKQELFEKINILQEEQISFEKTIFENSSIEEFEQAIKEYERIENFYRETITTFKNISAQIELQLKNPLQCPNCNSFLHYHSGKLEPIDIEKLKKEKESCEKSIKVKLRELTEIQLFKTEAKQGQEQIKQYKINLQSTLNSLKIFNEELSKIEITDKDYLQKIKELEDNITIDIDETELESNLKEAEDNLASINQLIGAQKEIKKNILKWKEELIQYNQELKEISDKLLKLGTWFSLFPLIKQGIIDSYLPIFESRINYFLGLLNISFSIRLALEKEKKSGGFKQEFQILVTDEHGKERQYDSYSEGERRRIAVCVGFALRDIAISRKALPFDFIKIDEIVDGLDETGVNEFFKLLKTIIGQKLIVSHNANLKGYFNNIINMHRKNGITKIEVNCGNTN